MGPVTINGEPAARELLITKSIPACSPGTPTSAAVLPGLYLLWGSLMYIPATPDYLDRAGAQKPGESLSHTETLSDLVRDTQHSLIHIGFSLHSWAGAGLA